MELKKYIAILALAPMVAAMPIQAEAVSGVVYDKSSRTKTDVSATHFA